MPSLATLPLVVESQNIVRRRVFRVDSMEDVPGVLHRLKREKFTGSVVVNVSQGACNSVSAEESAPLPAL